ncbi:phosphoribosylformylglycinamidine cyclo-ligase [Anaerococcus vaginalis]|uniref:phosphoribosylformylglycinamidine cyclo-ligase n=1 Tax=Anaerococcus vaginalis TaxID=33037 RepID=UPI00242C98BF|nr:phosphoribosylformylglycinamidine cyclo-ligase [Anaerococcus vaginalis]MBS6920588.1 phosphoribosylformylglycinamidine cyclo-ligase [Anaerococcus vaginalis]MDU1707251.1 phosphoribosylformylglycinamidine cyclo-ligase [Anaerococcus vaginalis]MDU1762868.1 phosphoribosylformylglycinamidine cyclo-ligase [Anaerococcus vaginalis]MDU5560422.1 phosphoribosylformylglycinamidine cyclo-ligase [Anaerococcus vaginalis]MDU5988853.1 phosphoribosylformylglycinamidine cyclo-ligase [Anaerococcus vaginalis]
MPINYKDAGVDVANGQKEVELIKNLVEKTQSENVLSKLGGFSGLFSLENLNIKNPVLVSGTDGVGTKVMLAQMMDKHDTIGIDCVAMCVNDILCQGAKPLFFLDYIACGKLVPEKMEKIVKGVADGCLQANSSLIGGETAEMPGLYKENDYDLAGFCVGIVDKEKIITGEKIKKGDHIFGLKSSGIHSNGYSLVRKIVLEKEKLSLDEKIEGLDTSLGEELLKPTKIYVKEILALLEKIEINGLSHITGGGFYENIPRMIPDGLCAKIDMRNIPLPKIFSLLEKWGELDKKDMYETFNMGVGLVFAVDKKDIEKVKEIIDEDELLDLGEVIENNEKIDLKF